MRISFFVVVTFLFLGANAASVAPSQITSIAAEPAATELRRPMDGKGAWGMMGLALDARFESQIDQTSRTVTAPSYSIGWGYQHFLGVLEYSTREESRVGNSTFSTQSANETAMLWGQYYTDDEWKFRPFFGVGLGGYRETMNLKLYNDSVDEKGRWDEIYGAAFGFRWAAWSPVWLTLEGRVLFSRDLDPSPMMSGLFKIGFVLE